MPGFLNRRKEAGPQGTPRVESTQVPSDTSFRIKATSVNVEIFSGDPKKPDSFSGVIQLDEPTYILGSVQADGTVSGVLDSEKRKQAVGNKEAVIKENGDLAEDLSSKQRDLQKLLAEHLVRRGTLVKAVITAPASAVLPQQSR
jgi:hypothetical protein